MSWRRFGLAAPALLLLAVAVTPFFSSGKAQAAAACSGGVWYGRQDCHGYFTNRAFAFTGFKNILSNGIEVGSLGSYLDAMSNDLFGGSTQDVTGAAFTIDIMLGHNGPEFGGSQGNGIAFARNNFGTWANLVTYYSNRGLIDWVYNWSTPQPYENSAWSSADLDDDFHQKDAQTIPVIRFRVPPGTAGAPFMIERICGNLLGDRSGLAIPNYTLTGDFNVGSGTPGFGGIVESGVTYNLSPYVRNGSAAGADGFSMELNDDTGGNINQPGSPRASGWATDAYLSGGCIARTPNGCWHWDFDNGLPGNTTSTQTNGVSFQVGPNVADGTTMCYHIVIAPNTFNGGTFSGPQHCFVVYRPHYPSIVGTNGDIHAGGGLCGNAAVGTGNVTTNPQSNSLGSYVISASGAINGIGSNNAAGSTAATLGKTGGYYTVCRQDLVAAAQAYINGGGVYAPLGDVSVNLGTLAPGIYLHNSGGTLTLTGTFSNQITIVSLAGKVAISGNVILNAPSTTASNAPSLGIISRGDIDINAGATRVDGYLFSNSDINTCTQANSACLNTLTVNGFLMGNGINFQRMGPKISNSTATTGEQINLTGQIYLNPPKLFGDLANINLLEAQGEKPPLN